MQSPQGPYRAPPPVFAGQDLEPLMLRVPQRRGEDGPVVVPAVRLDLITVRNGWIAVGDGLDGMVLTEDRRMVRQMAMFSQPGRARRENAEIDLPEANTVFDDVFIGFDAAWTNWYHWLCFALPRSALAARFTGQTCVIPLPDYPSRAVTTPIRFTEATWRQSLAAFGLSERVTLLPPGLYRAKRIRFLWTTPDEPTNLTLLHEFQALFADVRRGLRADAALARRIVISREAGGDWRITPLETALLNQVARRFGFSKLTLEKLDFVAQMQLIAGAEAVASVHGAGMSNLLFGCGDLKVLEINLPLDGGVLLRPWFYLIAHARRMPYRFLNSARAEVTEQHLIEAFESLALTAPR